MRPEDFSEASTAVCSNWKMTKMPVQTLTMHTFHSIVASCVVEVEAVDRIVTLSLSSSSSLSSPPEQA